MKAQGNGIASAAAKVKKQSALKSQKTMTMLMI
jgi:hypothetical protein